MRYPTVLFDLDHTLFDSDASFRAAFDTCLTTAGVRGSTEHFEAFDELNRRLWQRVEAGTMTPPQIHIERFRALASWVDTDVEPEALALAFGRALADHGELYPGAAELLGLLHERGVTLALVTNGLSEVQRGRIDRLGLGDLLDAIVISAEVGTAKPAAEIFDITFAALGEPDRAGALMVGDNPPSDIRGALDYGIATCWYNPSGRSTPDDLVPTHELRDLRLVADLVLA